jgi:hypothetical protein
MVFIIAAAALCLMAYVFSRGRSPESRHVSSDEFNYDSYMQARNRDRNGPDAAA